MIKFTGDSKDRNLYEYSYYGVNLSFGYNTYHVMKQGIESLKQDKRAFTPVVLAARMMMEAKGEPKRRANYARELLKIMRERDYDNKKKWAILFFIGHILRLQDGDIDSELRGEFLVQIIPLSEYQKQSEMEYLKEEGKLEVARNMLADGFSAEQIRKYTGLDEEDILALG